jgi:hypothetical protein
MSSQLPVTPTTSPTPPDSGSEKSGFSTSEFATSAGVILTNLLGIAAIVWKLAPDQVEQLQHMGTASIAAAAVLIGNALIAWRYLESRKSLKATSINAEATIQNVKTLSAANPNQNSPAQEQAILASISSLHQPK